MPQTTATMPATQEHGARKPREIRALTGARALPPLLLVLFHYQEGHGYQGYPLFDVFVAKGYLWVEFFFALSGFVLMHVYGPRAQTLYTGSGYLDFLKNRLARLYPVHLAMLLITLALVIVLGALAALGGYHSVYQAPNWHPDLSVASFFANLFLIQSWHLFAHLSWNWVAWFVSVEFFLCLIFPLYLVAARGGGLRAVMLIALGYVTLHNLAQQSGHGLDITHDLGVVRGMADFAIGAGLAMLYRDWHARLEKLPEIAFTLAQTIVFAAFLYAMYHTGWSHHAADFWIVPPMTLLIGTLAFDRGWLARLFQAKALRKLGEWSFAIYMGQTAWLMLLRFAEQRIYPQTASAHWVHIVEPIALLIICTAWGALLYRFVEQPANHRLRAWFRSVSPQTDRDAATPS